MYNKNFLRREFSRKNYFHNDLFFDEFSPENYPECPTCHNKKNGAPIYGCLRCGKKFCSRCCDYYDDIIRGKLHSYCPGCGVEVSTGRGQLQIGSIVNLKQKRQNDQNFPSEKVRREKRAVH